METAPTYDPQDPIFSKATLPDDFSLADMAHYPDLPTGLTELTIDGAEMHGREIPLIRLDQGWRTFLLKEDDGAAALVRLTGRRLSETTLIDYLQNEARHVTGFHVRGMGLLAAVLYDLACAYASANQWFLDDQRERLPEQCARVSGQPTVTHEIHQHVVSIEVEDRVPAESVMLKHAESCKADGRMWEEALGKLPEWVASGRLPQGISVYREDSPGQPSRLQPLSQAPRVLRSSDIFIVTSPEGVACMLCLDTLHTLGYAYTLGETPLVRWLERNQPQLVNTIAHGAYSSWSHIEALCLYAAEVVISDHRRGLKNRAWPAGRLPPIRQGRQFWPFVLNYSLYEKPFVALDMAQILQEG